MVHVANDHARPFARQVRVTERCIRTNIIVATWHPGRCKHGGGRQQVGGPQPGLAPAAVPSRPQRPARRDYEDSRSSGALGLR